LRYKLKIERSQHIGQRLFHRIRPNPEIGIGQYLAHRIDIVLQTNLKTALDIIQHIPQWTGELIFISLRLHR